jgi:hypothetical protein
MRSVNTAGCRQGKVQAGNRIPIYRKKKTDR